MNAVGRPAGRSRRATRVSAPVAPVAARPAPARPPAWLHPALLSAWVALALYAPTLNDGFVWDDHHLIERNPLLRAPGHLLRALTTDFWGASGAASGFWRPLVTLSYALDGRLSHWNPAWFHAVNVLAHAATSAVFALVLLELPVAWPAALFGGVAFAAMPVHVESVAWIAGRTDVLCALGVVAALGLDRRARRAGRRRPGLLPLLALAFALLAKEAAAACVVLIAVAEWVDARGRRFDLAAAARWLAPYALLTVAWLVAHALVAARPALPEHLDALARLRARAAAWSIFPAALTFLWPWATHSPAVTLALPARGWTREVIASAAFQGAFLAWLGVALARRARLALPLALVWTALLPLTVVGLAFAVLLFAERYLYLASVGAAWALALGLDALRPWERARPIAARAVATVAWGGAIVVALGGAVETWRLVPAWSDDARLFRTMTEVRPRNAMAHVGWAEILAGRGETARALEELRLAEALDPTRSDVSATRARLHFREGAWRAVLADAARATALDSAALEPRLLYAGALLRLGRASEAAAELAPLAARAPENPAVASAWGQCLLGLGRVDEALPVLEGAAAGGTDDADLAFALGMARARRDRLAGARDAFARAVALDPTFYDAWLRLATAEHLLADRTARDRALAGALALPQSADGRAAALRERFAAAPR